MNENAWNCRHRNKKRLKNAETAKSLSFTSCMAWPTVIIEKKNLYMLYLCCNVLNHSAILLFFVLFSLFCNLPFVFSRIIGFPGKLVFKLEKLANYPRLIIFAIENCGINR